MIHDVTQTFDNVKMSRVGTVVKIPTSYAYALGKQTKVGGIWPFINPDPYKYINVI